MSASPATENDAQILAVCQALSSRYGYDAIGVAKRQEEEAVDGMAIIWARIVSKLSDMAYDPTTPA